MNSRPALNENHPPFGSLLPGRSYQTTTYKYGFNGKENDNEVKGTGNQQDYGFRIYDPRLGKFLSVDPLTKEYPWYTPYQFAGNTPVQAIDLDGAEIKYDMDIQDPNLNGASKLFVQSFKDARATTLHIGMMVMGGWFLAPEAIPFMVQWGSKTLTNPVAISEISSFIWGLGTDEEYPFPSVGDNISKSFRLGLKKVTSQTLANGNSKRVIKELGSVSFEAGSKFKNEGERRAAKLFAQDGGNVVLQKEKRGQPTADLLVNGTPWEVKTMASVDPSKISGGVMSRISDATNQSKNVFIDMMDQKGATLENATQGVADYFKTYDTAETVRVVGDGFDKTFKKSDFKN